MTKDKFGKTITLGILNERKGRIKTDLFSYIQITKT